MGVGEQILCVIRAYITMDEQLYKYQGRKAVLFEDSPMHTRLAMAVIGDRVSADHHAYEVDFRASVDTTYTDASNWPDIWVLDIAAPYSESATDGNGDSNEAGIRCFEYIRSREAAMGIAPTPVLFHSTQSSSRFYEKMEERGFSGDKDNFWYFDKPCQTAAMGDTLDQLLEGAA